jgi:RNA polymerase subunit RPABC4/transcription elongation factor Spt4
MKRESSFKYIFWGLVVVIVLLLIPLVMMLLRRATEFQYSRFLLLFPLFILVPAYIIIVGRLVYLDAAKRGLDPWLWATVAVFVPNLIGVIIYLVVRQSAKNTCLNCGKKIEKDFKICPYCGQKQELVCENCKKAVARDWSVCPYCAHPLPGEPHGMGEGESVGQ